MPPGLGSNSAWMPIQRTIFTGSVKNVKIISGGAAMYSSLTIGSAATRAPWFLFCLTLQPSQAIFPKSIEKGAQLDETLGTKAIEPTRSLAPLVQESSFGQDAQMLRNGRSRGAEVPGDLASAQFARANELENGHATRLGESSQYYVGVLRRVSHDAEWPYVTSTDGWAELLDFRFLRQGR
jgi:hypothetical protein